MILLRRLVTITSLFTTFLTMQHHYDKSPPLDRIVSFNPAYNIVTYRRSIIAHNDIPPLIYVMHPVYLTMLYQLHRLYIIK